MGTSVGTTGLGIAPELRFRYIKLGEGNGWAEECFRDNTVRISFDTEAPEVFELCLAGDWDAVHRYWVGKGKSVGKATEYKNQLSFFYEDDGSTIWVTLCDRKLYWTRLTGEPPQRDSKSSWRTCTGWNCTDLNGRALTYDRLPGYVTAKEIYPGTSCSFNRAEGEELRYRINAEVPPTLSRAQSALSGLQAALLPVIRKLWWKDFEILGALLFESSGWRRTSEVGGEQKTIDLDLVLPSTGAKAIVQIKSSTDQKQFDEYLAKFHSLGTTYSHMFYVYHTGSISCSDPRVHLVGPGVIEKRIVDAGLTEWVLNKVS
jgi:hypothetical protein